MPQTTTLPLGNRAVYRHAFLDGVRGLAALFVVLHHAWYEVFATGGQTQWHPSLSALTSWLFYGHHAVDVFIVVSGFCLGLPLVGSSDQYLPGGMKRFYGRRARRIIPPYYAAIALSLALIALVPLLGRASDDRWSRALPGLSWEAIGSHLLLIHNLFGSLIWQINPPMWSIATECQIYVVFALLLVPVQRRLRMVAAMCVAILVGALPGVFTRRFDEACPWFTFLFGLGWLAAWVAHSNHPAASRLRPQIRWRSVARGALVLYLLLILGTDRLRSTGELADSFVGLVASIVILDLAISRAAGLRRMVLESHACRWLGRCSYSLYLVHFPLIALAHVHLREAGISPNLRLVGMLLLAVPATVAIAFAFFLLFERPFQTTRSDHSAGQIPLDPRRSIITPPSQAGWEFGRYSG